MPKSSESVKARAKSHGRVKWRSTVVEINSDILIASIKDALKLTFLVISTAAGPCVKNA